MTTVVVFGGAGFLGRRLVHRLVTEGMTVRVAVRHPDPARFELRSIGFDRVMSRPASPDWCLCLASAPMPIQDLLTSVLEDAANWWS